MKITWSNIHYIVFTVIILNFIMVYYLKEREDDSTLDKATVNNESIIVLQENTTNVSKVALNSSLSNTNIAEDIGKAVSDSGNTIPVIDSGVKQFLDVIGTEDKILAPASVVKDEYNSISTVVVMLILLVAIALGVTFLEKKSIEQRNKTKSKRLDINNDIHFDLSLED